MASAWARSAPASMASMATSGSRTWEAARYPAEVSGRMSSRARADPLGQDLAPVVGAVEQRGGQRHDGDAGQRHDLHHP